MNNKNILGIFGILITSFLALNAQSYGLHNVIDRNEVEKAKVVCEGDVCLQNISADSEKGQLLLLKDLDKLMEKGASPLLWLIRYYVATTDFKTEDSKIEDFKTEIDGPLQYLDLIQENKHIFSGKDFENAQTFIASFAFQHVLESIKSDISILRDIGLEKLNKGKDINFKTPLLELDYKMISILVLVNYMLPIFDLERIDILYNNLQSIIKGTLFSLLYNLYPEEQLEAMAQENNLQNILKFVKDLEIKKLNENFFDSLLQMLANEVKEQKGIFTLFILLQETFFLKSVNYLFLEAFYEAYPQETMDFVASYLGLGNMSKELVSDKIMSQPILKLLSNKIINFTDFKNKDHDSLIGQHSFFMVSIAKNHYGSDIKFLSDFYLQLIGEEGKDLQTFITTYQNLINKFNGFPKGEQEKCIRALREILLQVINKLATADKELKKALLAEMEAMGIDTEYDLKQ